jgi:xylulokinase
MRPASHPPVADLVRPAQQAQVDAVNAKLGRENVLRYTANPVLTGFTLPKLLWVRDNEPRISSACARCCCPRITCASA